VSALKHVRKKERKGGAGGREGRERESE